MSAGVEEDDPSCDVQLMAFNLYVLRCCWLTRDRMDKQRSRGCLCEGLVVTLQRILPPKMPFFVRENVQILSKILPKIQNFAIW